MAARLEGKLVFVTAAAQGMGRASVLALAREGARIIATDIRADLLETLKSEVIAAGGIAPDIRTLDVTAPGAGGIAAAMAYKLDRYCTVSRRVTAAGAPGSPSTSAGSLRSLPHRQA